jgi:two-component system LytT family sensor kinase
MKTPDFKYITGSYYRLNLVFGVVGIIAGMVMITFESVIQEKWVSLRTGISNLIFSVLMTIVVTNFIYVFECYYPKSRRKYLWQFVLLYCLGLSAGYELSYFLLSLIFHFQYSFTSHFSDYRLSLLIGLVISTIIYFYRAQQATYSAKLKEKELALVKVNQLITQAELQTLQSKINPHFLYNSLNSIASLIREDADKAEDMTIKLSRLFRYSINSPQENMALVSEEMEIVNTYLDIEKIRFGDRLNFIIDIDESVKNCSIPRFLLQPLVENALKHGLNNVASKGELKININKDSENIIICIADNGKPFPAELNMGYGLQSTYDKLTLLYGENYQVQITNTPEKEIKIIIPATA